MAIWIFLAILAVPFVEIALFIKVGSVIGVIPTLALVVLTVFLGVFVLRRQGLQTVANVRSSFRQGLDPSAPLFNGLLVFLAGALLIVPGFFTDAVGLLILLPPVRKYIMRQQFVRVQRAAGAGSARPGTRQGRRGDTIEADFEVVEENEDDGLRRRGSSGWTRP